MLEKKKNNVCVGVSASYRLACQTWLHRCPSPSRDQLARLRNFQTRNEPPSRKALTHICASSSWSFHSQKNSFFLFFFPSFFPSFPPVPSLPLRLPSLTLRSGLYPLYLYSGLGRAGAPLNPSFNTNSLYPGPRGGG